MTAAVPDPSVRVAISFRMFSPYILARLGAAARVCELKAIEGSHRSSTYAWDPMADAVGFEREVLFADKPIEDTPPADIVRAMRAALDKANPQVVCIGGWFFVEALAMLAWAAERGAPVIVLSESTAHDHKRLWWREAVKRFILRYCSAALVGGAAHESYVRALGMPADRIFIGYDIVDNAYFAKESDRARKDAARHRTDLGLPNPFFLVSSRFIPIKNLDRLLDAYALYRARTAGAAWDLVLVGDGEERRALEARASALGIADSVRFQGFQQYDRLPVYYGLAEAFVHVSTVEPWGLVVNEALAAGLPVIVSDRCGCAADLVEDGENGYVVDPFDTADIAEKLVLFASDAVDQAAMGRRGRQSIAAWGPDRFGWGLAKAIETSMRRPVRPAGVLARWAIRLAAIR